MSKEALHSTESSEWYTPHEIIEAARNCMGSIDLDPYSCEAANGIVRADLIRTLEAPRDDEPWIGRVWCNPPNPPRPAWEKMLEHWQRGGVGIFLAYSIEQLQQSQRWGRRAMLDFPVCVPEQRVRFLCTAADNIAKLGRRVAKLEEKLLKIEADIALELLTNEREEVKRRIARANDEIRCAPTSGLVLGEQPAHASAIVGVGVCPVRFRDAFSGIGRVIGGGR